MRYQQLLGRRDGGNQRGRSASSERPLKDWTTKIRRGRGSDNGNNKKVGMVLLSRALLTAVLCAVTVVVLKIYEDWGNRGNFSRTQKNILNTIMTALSIALGINFIGSFKGLANAVRWKFLGNKSRDEERVELILGAESFLNVFKLMLKSRAAPISAFLCLTWLILGLAAQVFVAVIGLTFESNDGTNYNDTFLVSGRPIHTPKLDCFYHYVKGPSGEGQVPVCPGVDSDEPKNEETLQTIAHTYGDSFNSVDLGFYSKTSDIVQSEHNYQYWIRSTPEDFNARPQRYPHDPEFAFRYSEYNPADNEKVYPSLTDRVITASSGECYEYSVTQPETLVPDLNGITDGSWLYHISNGTKNDTITVQQQSEADSGTTYIYRGETVPQNESDYSCGPRCIWMWVHRSKDSRQTEQAFFQCPITISDVINGTKSEYKLPNGMARVAAASIGLQGRRSNATIWTQYFLYPFGHTWSLQYQPRQRAGANMAEYAIRSLAAMAARNPVHTLKGRQPVLGTHLEVKWYFAIPLLAGIAGAHLVLVLATIFYTRDIVIPSDSLRSEAMVLQPLAQREHAEGGALRAEGNVHPTHVEGREGGSGWQFG